MKQKVKIRWSENLNRQPTRIIAKQANEEIKRETRRIRRKQTKEELNRETKEEHNTRRKT